VISDPDLIGPEDFQSFDEVGITREGMIAVGGASSARRRRAGYAELGDALRIVDWSILAFEDRRQPFEEDGLSMSEELRLDLMSSTNFGGASLEVGREGSASARHEEVPSVVQNSLSSWSSLRGAPQSIRAQRRIS
jgi:hypothetical protein